MMFFFAFGMENREEFVLTYRYRPEFFIFRNRIRRRAILFDVSGSIRELSSEPSP
jgi:hypothetical protein